MRRIIYATLAIASVMAITLAGTAQAEEVCFAHDSNRSTVEVFGGMSVTSPEPGKLAISWEYIRGEEYGPFYERAVIFLHEGTNALPTWPILEVPGSQVRITVKPGVWSVTGYDYAPYFGVLPCHSPMQYFGSATVAAPKAAPLRAARRTR